MKAQDVQEAREDPGRNEWRTAFSRRRRRRLSRRLNETMVEFRNVGTPACTRETERLLCVDGHRAAVQEKKEMGHRRSYREQQPRW